MGSRDRDGETYHLVLLECETALLVERWAAGACVSVVDKQTEEDVVDMKPSRCRAGQTTTYGYCPSSS